MPSPRKRVAVVGATGIAGQQFLVALDRHPWFEVVKLAASERSAGKTYAAAIRDPKTGARRWWCSEPPPARALELTVENGDGLELSGVDLVFSAVESAAARVLEPQYAKTTAVLSTASAFRYEDDVPIMVPGVNFAHAPDARRHAAVCVTVEAGLRTIGIVVHGDPSLRR